MSSPRRPYLRLSGGRGVQPLRQATRSECGLACLAMVAAFHGMGTDLPELRRRHPIGVGGASLARLADIAKRLGFSARPLALSLDELDKLKLPCILHWRFDHFVVLERINRRGAVVSDPAVGRSRLPFDALGEAFTGVALELEPADGFARRGAPPGLSLRALLRVDRELIGGTLAALVLSTFSEIALLAAPYYLQLVIDEVLLNGDRELLGGLVAGFAGVALFRVASDSLRQLTVQRLGSVVSFDLSARIMRRLLELRIDYFESRSLGDLQHRVQALDDIQRFVVSTAPKLALDCAFCLLTGAVLIVYQPAVALSAIAIVTVYLGWRLIWLRPFRGAAEDVVETEATVQSTLLVTLSSMTTIKLVVAESARASRWMDDTATGLNARIRAGNLAVIDQSVAGTLFGLARVGIVAWLAHEALSGELSIGMISAFVAYYGMFNQRALAVVAGIVEWKLLRVPLARLADIVFGDVETTGDDAAPPRQLAGRLTLDKVRFRYTPDTPALFDGLSADIAAGEFVAITGHSGAGKSTLLKLVCGLLEAESGRILYDDRDWRQWSRQNLRAQIATALQTDSLLSGSLAENIAAGRLPDDRERLVAAARAAAIHDDIVRLPLGYETKTGDLGTAFSAGQVQRLLLARALYRACAVLVLDEITSGLDADTECRVLASLSALTCTRIFVTHRPSVVRAADRVLTLRAGRLIDGTAAGR